MTILKQLSNKTNLFPRNSFEREKEFNFGVQNPVHCEGYDCSCDLGFWQQAWAVHLLWGYGLIVQKYHLWIRGRVRCRRPLLLVRCWLALLQCSVISTAREGFLKDHWCDPFVWCAVTTAHTGYRKDALYSVRSQTAGWLFCCC